MEDGLYRFGVFRDGKLALPFSVIEAGMDLGSNPYQHLKILAVSFADLDNDGQRDVTVIGQNLVANGDRVFVQVYWGCGERFLLDDKIDLAIEENLIKASLVNVNKVQQFVRKRKLHPSCG